MRSKSYGKSASVSFLSPLFPFHCHSCETKDDVVWVVHGLCSMCFSRLAPAVPFDGFAVRGHSLYQYADLMRALILKVKIRGCRRSYHTLENLFLSHPLVNKICRQHVALVPAPSSLWSRVRGRFDLAWMLAEACRYAFSVPRLLVPWSKLWRWRKQAFMGSRSERLRTSSMAAPTTCIQGPSLPKLLLIDDVITSGQTILSMQHYYTGWDCEFMTLASVTHRD
jgi:predicted amidophosphoribosyltransferase